MQTLKGRIGKQIVKPLMTRQVRSAVRSANNRIAKYEANDAGLEDYVSMVSGCGKDLYQAIVEPKGGNADLAGRFGGVLASLTTLEDMLRNRESDLANRRYNPLKTENDVNKATVMYEDYKANAIEMMGRVLNNDMLKQQTSIEQAKLSFAYLKSPRNWIPLAMTSPLYMGCACDDCAETELCGPETCNPRVTCGGLAVAIIAALACWYCSEKCG
jgi:hypothetical protein